MRLESRKKIQFFCLIAIILFLILFLKASYNQWPITALGKDFAAYWSSARLLTSGQNPYQSDQIFALQKSLGLTDKEPTVIYNPPWAITYILPFASENYLLGKFLWLLFIFICTLICSLWLWQFYGGTDTGRIWGILILFTYVHLYFTFVRGQIVPLILLGVVGFLHFEKQKKWFLAGVFVCLLGIKPQDTYLFLIALLFWIIYKKQWGILLGATCATIFITAIPLFYNPDIFFQYYTEILANSFQHKWQTPTAGYWLISLWGTKKHFFEYLPTIAGAAWLFYHWHRNYTKWEWAGQVPLLLFVSLMTTFYVWSNDYLLLIVAIIQASIWLISEPLRPYSKFMIFLYVLINLMAWVFAFSFRSEKWAFWMVPALFINYLLIKNYSIKGNAKAHQLENS
ncbi:MAG: glycosyltransferase family 87 protein [Smithella sp.]